MDSLVAIYRQRSFRYSDKKPYFPPSIFEEYPFDDSRIDRTNELYASVRELFKLLKLDMENFGKRNWNPLSSFISPGNTVLLKPNLVRHKGERNCLEALITHGSLIRAVTDYVYIALKGEGRIIIADGPMDDADFRKILNITGLQEVRDFYRENANFNIEIYDLRQERVIKSREKIVKRIRLSGDPAGYTVVDLGDMSEFKKDSLDYRLFRGAESKLDIMYKHHNAEKDEYLISNTFLNADVIINLPKMKTHKGSGVTLSLKNIIGITGDRNWLPHSVESVYREQDKMESVTVCLRFLTVAFNIIKKLVGVIRPLRDRLRQLVGVTKSTIHDGNWYGNDILWRTIIDLAHITCYADRRGVLTKNKKRKIFVIVDGVIAGEGDGPLNPQPKQCGILIGGFNGFSVDVVTARLMGFDPKKIPKFRDVSKETLQKICFSGLNGIKCLSNIDGWNKRLSEFEGPCLNFKPHYGWKYHIEVDDVKK